MILAFSLVVFPVLINTYQGVKAVDPKPRLAVNEMRGTVRWAEVVAGPEPSLRALLSGSPLTFTLFYATYSCVFIVGYGTSAWGPTILMRVYDASPGQAGAIFAR